MNISNLCQEKEIHNFFYFSVQYFLAEGILPWRGKIARNDVLFALSHFVKFTIKRISS